MKEVRMKTKVCTKCGKRKMVVYFPLKGEEKRFGSWCKVCENDALRKTRKEKPEIFVGYELKKNYNLTMAAKNQKFESQGRVCAVCKSPKPNTKKKWFVDHDHKTEVFRGVLCGKCNLILGFADDSIEILAAAIVYLVQRR